MDPEYVTGQINSPILELLLRRLCTVSKILIPFTLIFCFSSECKRYSSHLQVWIMHRVAPIKVFLP